MLKYESAEYIRMPRYLEYNTKQLRYNYKGELVMVKVVKFRWKSLASADQFKKVGNIIRAEESRRYVVPSAPGKRFSEDTKVTDMLYKCYAEAEAGKNLTSS